MAKDPEFIEDYKKITGEDPDIVRPAEIEPIFERMRNVDPQIKQVLKEAVGKE